MKQYPSPHCVLDIVINVCTGITLENLFADSMISCWGPTWTTMETCNSVVCQRPTTSGRGRRKHSSKGKPPRKRCHWKLPKWVKRAQLPLSHNLYCFIVPVTRYHPCLLSVPLVHAASVSSAMVTIIMATVKPSTIFEEHVVVAMIAN